MKTIAITTAALIALAAPALAQDLSPVDIANRHFAQSEEPGEAFRPTAGAVRGTIVSSAGSALVAKANAHFAKSEEPGEAFRPTGPGAGGTVFATSNADLAARAAAILDNGEKGDN